MLKILPSLPDKVLGVQAFGEVSGDDYERVLLPELESRLARHETIRFLYILGEEFSGFSVAAAWQDTRVGMRYLTRFERVAVVTDLMWLRRTIIALGLAMPAEVRVYPLTDTAVATAWLEEPRPPGTLEFRLDAAKGVLVIEPQEALTSDDFERVAQVVDPYIDASGELAGVVVFAAAFPGWKDLAALSSHFRFVRDHHRRIRRLALVTDSPALSAMRTLAGIFVDAEVRDFPAGQRAEAMQWVSERS